MKLSRSDLRFNIAGYAYAAACSLACLLPFLLVISASFTQEHSILAQGYSLIPRVFSLEAYRSVFKYPQVVLQAYKVSAFVTAAGSLTGLFLVAMTAYVLQRRNFRYRNQFSFFIFFTTLFNGGLVPYYILMIRYLGLKDNLLALILPMLMGAMNIILMRNFMKSIPEEIYESARMDGAQDFRIFVKLYIPLSKPGLATIGLFMALAYWNDWFNASLFMNSKQNYPLQYMLYQYLTNVQVMKTLMTSGVDVSQIVNMPTESLKMATAVVATGPIVILYPFVQKYFVKGLVVGAVKG